MFEKLYYIGEGSLQYNFPGVFGLYQTQERWNCWISQLLEMTYYPARVHWALSFTAYCIQIFISF